MFWCLYNTTVTGQTVYTSANAHSHNDYLQHTPFYQAFNEQFGSIEADIHLRNGLLLVAHDSADVKIIVEAHCNTFRMAKSVYNL